MAYTDCGLARVRRRPGREWRNTLGSMIRWGGCNEIHGKDVSVSDNRICNRWWSGGRIF